MSTTSWLDALSEGIDSVISPKPLAETRREMVRSNEARKKLVRNLSRSTKSSTLRSSSTLSRSK